VVGVPSPLSLLPARFARQPCFEKQSHSRDTRVGWAVADGGGAPFCVTESNVIGRLAANLSRLVIPLSFLFLLCGGCFPVQKETLRTKG
jgi:hypothetical protein